jgi:hypothetical protein
MGALLQRGADSSLQQRWSLRSPSTPLTDGWMDCTVHGTEQGAWDYERRTREIQHL